MPPRQRSVTPTPTPSTAPQTPRKRKSPSKRLHGTQATSASPKWTPSTISDTLVKQLKLTFAPDPWQLFILDKIIQRFDAAICAGTSYGKSLIFEGLIALGGPGKVVVVLCPLKALEIDQVSSACAKGIDAVTINEDTPDTERKSMWKRIRSTAEIIYISPEMALSVGFQSLWADTKFRRRLTALIIDEGHCISEWGTQKFRPEYGLLNRLRSYTGQDVPFVTCTGTCPTATFDKIWTSLGFGCRPFWGIDVGCDRANLFFHTRIFEHPSKPTLDLLNFFPDIIDDNTKPDDLKKMLVYIDSEAACRSIRDDIRRLLPSALRSCVRAFSSDLSEAAKKQTWDELKSGQIRIVIATDAAGMGCNVDDIDVAVILGCPKSLSVVSQRWGRAGRARNSSGICVLLAPKWAFAPKVPLAVPAIAATQGKKKNDEESKQDMKKRENLAPSLEKFINLDDKSCLHKYLREEFRPTTQLSVRKGLRTTTATSVGHRARDSPYELIWTVVDLDRVPPLIRCCGHCNPELTASWEASDEHDPRRFAFSKDFLFANIPPPRPSSSMSASSTSSIIKPVNNRYLVSKESKQVLRRELEAWRERRHASRGGGVMFSAQVALPPKRVESLVENCRRFLQYPTISREHVLSIIRWDSAVFADLDEVVEVIGKWREGVVDVQTTPLSQRRASKKAKSGNVGARAPALSQPVFGSPVVPLLSTTSDSQDVFMGSAILSKPTPRYPLRITQPVDVSQSPAAATRRPLPRPAWNSTPGRIPPTSSSPISVTTPPCQSLARHPLSTVTPARKANPLTSPRASVQSITPAHSTLRAPSSLRHAYHTPSGTPYSNSSYYRQHTSDSTPSSSSNTGSSSKYYRT